MPAEICFLCGDAGTLRDGNPCPRCAQSRWVTYTKVTRVFVDTTTNDPVRSGTAAAAIKRTTTYKER